MVKKKEHRLFSNCLLAWFGANRRDLPWRRTYDPYHVWISEIMLQQTQMERGVEYFDRWVSLFPDVRAVADADELLVLKAWEGLGYYSRARNIRKAAGVLVAGHDGRVPDDYDRLLALPGVGPYTAAAIMSIAFDRPYPAIDANVARVFARLRDIDRPMKERGVQRELQALLAEMLAGVSPRDFNQALMELGALVCTPRNPDCSNCPVEAHCEALRADTVAERPVANGRAERIDIAMACAIVEHDGRIFIQQRQEEDIWGGLWEFPGGRLKEGETPEAAAVRELFEETELRAAGPRPFQTVIHHYTRYRVTLHSFLCTLRGSPEPRLHAASQCRWVEPEDLEQYPFPAGHRQLVAHLKQDHLFPSGNRRCCA
jgi:A/G-specific adenine glycosylase